MTDRCPLTPVDRLLNPANRAHMVLEEQLRELLDKLDLTCAMKSSGSRSKRAKLLKKEIAVLRNKLSQQHSQPPPAESGIGSFEEEGAQLGQETGEEGKHVLSVGRHLLPGAPAGLSLPVPAGAGSHTVTKLQAQNETFFLNLFLRHYLKRVT